MKQRIFCVLLGALVLTASSARAANKEHQQLMADLRILQEQAQLLQNLIGSVTDAIKAVNTRLDQQGETTRKAFADQKLVIDNLSNDVRVIREKLDDNNVRVGSLTQEIESLRSELDRLAASAPPRWNADPEDVRRSVGKLVLTLVEFIRQVLERQAIRRMEANTLTAEETESVGLALMRLEQTVRDLADQFGLKPEDLNLDLGPIGKLM